MATANGAPRSRRRWGGRLAGAVSGWTEAASGGCWMCTAAGVLQRGKSDAGARVEGSYANLDPNGARRSAKTAGLLIFGRVHHAGSDRWGLGHRGGVRRNTGDFTSGFPDWRPQYLSANQRDSTFTGAAL